MIKGWFAVVPQSRGWSVEVYTNDDNLVGEVTTTTLSDALEALREAVEEESGPPNTAFGEN